MQTRSSPNLQTLHRFAQQISLTGYESMSKDELFKYLKDKVNFDRLLRADARSNHSNEMNTKKRKIDDNYYNNSCNSSSSSSVPCSTSVTAPKRKCIKLNQYDPIMMTKIGKNEKCFKFVRPNGTTVRFSIEPLVDYLLSSGDFSDPETRIPFSDDNLKEIDTIAEKAGLKKDSVYEAKSNTHNYSEQKFRRDALLGLERCAGEVVTEMLQTVESYEPDDAQMQLVMRDFPTFMDYFKQLQDADREYASKCIAHWKLFIHGPPNRPNEDDYGLLHVIRMFLKGCDEGLLL